MLETRLDNSAVGDARVRSVRSRVAERLGRMMSDCLFRPTSLCREIRTFALWLEHDAFRRLAEAGRTEMRILVESETGALSDADDDEKNTQNLAHHNRLGVFLARLGIKSIALDTDLESNQVEDVLKLLWHLRRSVETGVSSWWDRLLGRHETLAAVKSQEGLHASCADVRIDGATGELSVRESYCQLTFSRAVTAYKSKVSRFKDHRAFFHAAPRYALLAAVAVMVPVLAETFIAVPWLTAFCLSLAVATIIGLSAYIVFETIGSEEYDKEHQAKQLGLRNAELSVALDRIQQDLQTARRIQRNFIPDLKVQPFPKHVAFSHTFVPEMEVGGDYYDLKRLDEHRVAILFTDVAGHGMAAAFVTGLIKTTFEIGRHGNSDTRAFVAEINDVLEKFTPSESFAAVIYAVYDIGTRVLCFTNAGHNPVPIVVRPAGREVRLLHEPVDLLAGVLPEIEYSRGEVTLARGDKVVMCTDGITDAMSPQGRQLGRERLLELLQAGVDMSAHELCMHVTDAVVEHVADAPQNDDRTMLIMEVLR